MCLAVVVPRMSTDSPPRSVRSYSGRETNAEMSVFGYLMITVLAVFLLPLLPFIVLYWLFDRLAAQ